MSEAFIAHASNALNTAWSQGNTLVVDCAPLTDALTSLSMTVNSLSGELGHLREQLEQMRSQQLTMNAENSALKTRLADLSASVLGLLDASTGMVGRQEYNAEMQQVRHDIDSRLKEQSDIMLARLGNVSRVSDEDRQRVLSLTEAVDVIRNSQLEGFTALRQSIGAAENNARGLNAERAQQHLQLSQKHDEFAVNCEHKMHDMKQAMLERMESNRLEAKDALSKHVSELLQHLEAHATRVDKLQRTLLERDTQMPAKYEIDKLVRSMEDSRAAVNDSQVQLQETFAQCMTLLESTAAKGQKAGLLAVAGAQGDAAASAARRRTTSMFSASINPASAAAAAAASTPMSPAASATATFTGGGGGAGNNPNASFASSLSNTFNPPPQQQQQQNLHLHHQQYQQQFGSAGVVGATGSFTHAFAIFENRLDQVQSLVERIMQEELPFLASDAKAKHEDHVVLVQAQRRAETMLVALCDVLGLGTADHFASVLRMPTTQKAQQIIQAALKRLLEPILPELVTPQFLSKAGSVLQSRSANTAAAANSDSAAAAAANDSLSAAERLMRNSTIAAAASRYEQAMKERGGGGGATPAKKPQQDESQQQQQQQNAGDLSSKKLRLGVDIADVATPDGNSGVGIMTVGPNSVADRSGLARGDIFVKVGGATVRTCEQFVAAVHLIDRRIKTEARAKNMKFLQGSIDAVVLRTVHGTTTEMPVTIELEWS